MRGLPITYVQKKKMEGWKSQLQEYHSCIHAATDFVQAIGRGDLETSYKEYDANQSNPLADSLLRMREQMKKIAEDERQRNWTNEGIAFFIEILRQENKNVNALAEGIITQIVKYMNANQGALYLIENNEDGTEFLEMKACVAYGRKKFLQQRFDIGTGLAGQAVLEKEMIYMTDIPKNYIRITSGLGEALPSCILIVPLISDDKVMGVVEIASFHKLLTYQIDFLKKVSESIAVTLSNLKSNERTKKLLEETQLQAAQMREQEEEMRQNLEELATTQEEMKRSQQQTEELLHESRYQTQLLQSQEEELRQNLEQLSAQQEEIQRQMEASEKMRKELLVREQVFGHTTILSETDPFGTITLINNKFCEVSGYTQEELIGKPQSIVRHPDMQKVVFKLMWSTIREGNVFKGIVKNRKKDGGHYWVDATIVPVKDDNGKIIKYIGARYHIQNDALAEQLYQEQMGSLQQGEAIAPATL